MATGRSAYQARTKPSFVLKMRDLGYMVEQQQETIQMLSGLVVSMAEEIDSNQQRITALETRQPAVFTGQ
ncbi:MAG: hypothetical protein ABL993_00875 [Vicinamibacterales bacterium]